MCRCLFISVETCFTGDDPGCNSDSAPWWFVYVSKYSPESGGIFCADSKKIDGPLTSRQQEIVECIVNGLSYKMAADKLGISLDTVRTHIKHIYQVLEINSKGELIRKTLDKR